MQGYVSYLAQQLVFVHDAPHRRLVSSRHFLGLLTQRPDLGQQAHDKPRGIDCG